MFHRGLFCDVLKIHCLAVRRRCGRKINFSEGIRCTRSWLQQHGNTAMFETLFTKPGTIEKHQATPLAEQRLRYLHHLAEFFVSDFGEWQWRDWSGHSREP